ncbi:MAG TPA: cell division protein ZipA C-terminal FtsZ-binding domain-containing protein [Burkholderiales bacterium]|nr:cell division protein ZipA C-terminal FtsZ-binding domain-containing protein [Burkholderiales bacterium]
MSDLQIGLAGLGALMVASVVAFNWWQERKFRRRSQETFPGRHEDVLLDQPAVAPTMPAAIAREAQEQERRIEPSMEPRLEPSLAAPSEAPVAAPIPEAPVSDVPRAEIDYIAQIRSGDFISPGRLAHLQRALPALQRRISFSGLDRQARAWEPLVADDARYSAVCVALQLVDRTGPVSDAQLREFGDAVRQVAGDIGAMADLPELSPALDRASELDGFCADVDVVVGINVIAGTGQVFHGTKIRALAEAAGLQLHPSGVFHCNDENGAMLFAVDNQESEPFVADRIRSITTPGITFLLDVPRVENGLRVFDKMVATARGFADSLGGTLADDNRALLNESGLDRIRGQLRAIYASMEQQGIEAGSPLALRLFS